MRPLCPWDFPGKNTGVGCHCLHQGIFPTQGLNSCLLHWQVESLSSEPPGKQALRRVYVCVCLITQLCLTLCNPWTATCQAPLSMGILQARILEWVTVPSYRGSSHPGINLRYFTIWVTRVTGFNKKGIFLRSQSCPLLSPMHHLLFSLLQSDFPPLPRFLPCIHISHTFGSNSLNRSAHHWVYTVFHPFSKVRVFLNRFDVVCLTSDMFQLTITWFGFFLRHQLQTVRYTHPKYVGWKVLIETYTCITNTPIKREHPIISERSLLSLQANHCISLEATAALISINVTWFYLLRNHIEMEAYVLFF